MLVFLKQREADSALDDGGPLMRPTDYVNTFSGPVGSDCRTQIPSGCSLVPVARYDQKPLQWCAIPHQHSFDPC